LSSATFAQTLVVKSGLNFASMRLKNEPIEIQQKPLAGLMLLGVSIEVPLSDFFSLDLGINTLSMKGLNNTSDIWATFSDTLYPYYSLWYTDFPLSAKINHRIGAFNFYGLLGPYLSLGLNTGSLVEWGSNSERDQLNRLDYGLNIGGGIEFYRFQLDCTYGIGLRNIASYNGNGGVSIKNRVLALTLGFRFENINWN
jgi:hypothetical protein